MRTVGGGKIKVIRPATEVTVLLRRLVVAWLVLVTTLSAAGCRNPGAVDDAVRGGAAVGDDLARGGGGAGDDLARAGGGLGDDLPVPPVGAGDALTPAAEAIVNRYFAGLSEEEA